MNPLYAAPSHVRIPSLGKHELMNNLCEKKMHMNNHAEITHKKKEMNNEP